jgi:hypothetical protein
VIGGDELMEGREKTATVDLKVRMKEALRYRIEAAARFRGASLNSEAVARLERSFEDQELLDVLLDLGFGRQMAGLLIVLGRAMRDTAAMVSGDAVRRGDDVPTWIDHRVAFDAATRAAEHVLCAFRPPAPERELDRHDEMAIAFGDLYAEGVLHALKMPDSVRRKVGGTPTDLAEWTERARRLLGPTVTRISLGGPVAFALPPPAATEETDP